MQEGIQRCYSHHERPKGALPLLLSGLAVWCQGACVDQTLPSITDMTGTMIHVIYVLKIHEIDAMVDITKRCWKVFKNMIGKVQNIPLLP